MVNTPSQVGIRLEGEWSLPQLQVGGCHIADPPAHGNLVLSPVEIISRNFTHAARAVTQSYTSVFKWPRQQHHITQEHKLIFRQILTANTNHHYNLHQLL